MIYREARPPRLGLAFSKDSTAHLPRDTAFLQDSASRPMYPPAFFANSTTRLPQDAAFLQDSTSHPMHPPHFSRIPPRTCRKVEYFPKIPFRTRCKPRIFARFDFSPAARSNPRKTRRFPELYQSICRTFSQC